MDDSVVLDSLAAHVRGRASVGAWRKFVEATGLLPISGAAAGRPTGSAYFFALPADGDSSLYIYGELHLEPDDKAAARLHLHWDLMPEGPIPQRIQRASRKVGGWPHVLQRIADCWPGDKAVHVEVSATYVIEGSVHELPPALRLKERPAKVRGHQLRPAAASWSVDPPSGPVGRLSVMPIRTNEIVLVASGQHLLTLSRDIEAELGGAVWDGIKTILGAR